MAHFGNYPDLEQSLLGDTKMSFESATWFEVDRVVEADAFSASPLKRSPYVEVGRAE